MYEIFEHTADLGLRVRARGLDALFAEAGRGLLSIIVANPDSVRGVQEKSYQLESESVEYLFFDWLSELLYTFETEGLLLSSFQIRLSGGRLQATCRGEKMDAQRHQMDHEIKAATYHQLRVERDGEDWLAEAILDI